MCLIFYLIAFSVCLYNLFRVLKISHNTRLVAIISAIPSDNKQDKPEMDITKR